MATVPQTPPASATGILLDWFTRRGWTPFEFQHETWAAYLAGESGLVHAPTGIGKTLAVWGGPLLEWLDETADAAHSRKNSPADNASPAPPPDSTLAPSRPDNPPAPPRPDNPPAPARRALPRNRAAPIRVLWLTPLRALATDTVASLLDPVRDLALPWSVELRTGDTSTTMRRRQRERLPTALVTTPESLSVMLSYPDTRERLATLRCVIVDEWHELLGTKRGVQTELALARLRNWIPSLRIWGLSATLGNLEQARDVLLGQPRPRQSEPPQSEPRPSGSGPASAPTPPGSPSRLISGTLPKSVEIVTLLPESVEHFPWAGHLGTQLVPRVIAAIAAARTTLLFTNTRSQAELWFQALLREQPDWLGLVALHHGSLDRDLRREVEKRLAAGQLKAVVATSSLDLGVDFAPVDQVIQVGSPKGIARLVQRAGRSGHQPGATSRVLCVPAHAFELVEFAAAREAALQRQIEAREPLSKPLDVLAQHLVTVGAGGGFTARELYDEVRTTYAFRTLTPDEWRWTLDFVVRGGPTLRAYPQYARLRAVPAENAECRMKNAEFRMRPAGNAECGGQNAEFAAASAELAEPETANSESSVLNSESCIPNSEFCILNSEFLRYIISSRPIERLHRLAIGTIASETSMHVRTVRGRLLGSIEEYFIARLQPGDRFVFAGKVLELARVREMTAYVRPARGRGGVVPRWMGGRFPLSTQLGAAVRRAMALGLRAHDPNGAAQPPAPRDPPAAPQPPELRDPNVAAQPPVPRDPPAAAQPPELLAAQPLIELQAAWSRVPDADELLIERTKTREGYHSFVYPFEGRLVHEGLSALLAYRLAQRQPLTLHLTANDYGFELVAAADLALNAEDWRALLSPQHLLEDLLACLNATQMARRQFRDIARVAGLVFAGYPGAGKTSRQLQASSDLFYDVFREFDPQNMLLEQARREVLEQQLEVRRLSQTLERLQTMRLLLVDAPRLTPLAFPLWSESLRSQSLSTERWADRVRKMAVQLEAARTGRPSPRARTSLPSGVPPKEGPAMQTPLPSREGLGEGSKSAVPDRPPRAPIEDSAESRSVDPAAPRQTPVRKRQTRTRHRKRR